MNLFLSRAPRNGLPLFVVAAFLCTAANALCGVQEDIDGLISASPTLQQGHIGFEFIDAQTGKVVAQRNPSQLFTPASNAKLYTTAFALVRLGITYKFKTSVRTRATSINNGAIPDLIFIAGGDPNLSGRMIPYSVAPNQNDPLTAIAKLADQIAAKGVKCIGGDIIADDSRYPYDPYPDGWTFDDGTWYYGAPVSAFSINDNSIHVTVAPTKPGDLAGVQLHPDIGSLIVLNEAITDGTNAAKINMSRPPGSNELVISGTIGMTAQPDEEDVAVPDPALFAAQALQYELQNRGVSIRGQAQAVHRDLTTVPNLLSAPRIAIIPSGMELASLESAPLFQAVQVINKVSQNLHAEMLLRETGYATRSIGTLAAGLEERKSFLAQAGIPENTYAFADGSGLARQDVTSPQATVALLRYMWNRPERQAWLDSLPIGGLDGTLKHRFKNIAGAERVHAKTGSLSHVAALSGYLETQSGKWLIFSMMANAELNDHGEVQKFFDAACGVLLKK
jgi:D-alanyl-D-alanine carboxypeptidase/D-alanyl-D-alanine-endopeptidase (penicillin-binding protein 4)